jgi:hypothetical protein
MTDTTLFAETTATTDTTAAPQAPAALLLPEEVVNLVGAGKKYATPEDALKSIPHAQAHIAKLEQEMQALREKEAKARSLDEVYEALVSRPNSAADTPPAQGVVDESLIDRVLDKKLEQRNIEQARTANKDAVKAALVDKFGDKANEQFQNKAKELGVSESFLTSVIAQSANAGLELFGLAKKENPAPSASPQGSINTQALPNTAQAKTTKSVMAGASMNEMVEAMRQAKQSITQ